MRIGIIGTDELGLTLAELWARAGHQVLVATADAEPSSELLEQLSEARVEAAPVGRRGAPIGGRRAHSPVQDHRGGSVSAHGRRKVVIDAMNAGPEDDAGASSSEVVAGPVSAGPGREGVEHPPGRAPPRGRPSFRPKEQRLAVVLSGDDARAKARASTLIEEIGFTPVDAGSLAHGAELQQPGSEIFGKPMLPAEARVALSLSR
jgi:hypothetical protein